jgi:fructosamine-3-kinase
MQQSDPDDIEPNPALVHGDTWQAAVSAWRAGWMREDAGRDKSLAQLMRLPMW